ncbi:ASCH domain-containing protein [Paenibacillus sp. FSL W8-0187]|jgi:uncharacterized protein YhfF|uniref:ASCH domain-containing protein n=1 Tax=Paenibacillus sp. FSL W8-0187 TaxID=2921710 RepID=UPI0030D6D5D9
MSDSKEYKMIFGWEDDNDLGEMLIQQILRGEKTATCAPKEEYSAEELKETYQSVKKTLTVYDKEGNARCKVRVKEVFETTFGNPDLRLVRGEGNGENVKQFQENHMSDWHGIYELSDDSILVVELFELVT